MTLQEVLKSLLAKHIEISFGSNGGLSGELSEVGEGIIVISGENDKKMFVAIDKIVTVSEISNNHSRPGFVT